MYVPQFVYHLLIDIWIFFQFGAFTNKIAKNTDIKFLLLLYNLPFFGKEWLDMTGVCLPFYEGDSTTLYPHQLCTHPVPPSLLQPLSTNVFNIRYLISV